MAKTGEKDISATPAVRVLKKAGIDCTFHTYPYEEKGGTAAAARELSVNENQVIKTLVMEDEGRRVFLVLMHGDREVSLKGMARVLGVKTVRPCDPDSARRNTGYTVGGISPFGIRKPLKVYVEASILELPLIYINAGKRGFLAQMKPKDLESILHPFPVQVAI